jgi:O-acetylserine/cysteine efflux transporter
MRYVDIFLALFASFIWGGTWIALKWSLVYFTPFTLLALRFFISALALLPFVKRDLSLPPKMVVLFTLIATFVYAGITLAIWLEIEVAVGIILMELSVPFSIVLAVIFCKENVSIVQIFGVAATFFGVFHAAGDITSGFSPISAACVFIAATGFACLNILLKTYSNYNSIGLLAYSHVGLSFIFAILAYCLEASNLNFIKHAPLFSIISLLCLSIIPTFAWISWCYLLKKYPIYLISSFQLFIPMWAILLSYMILGTELGITFVIGLGIVCVGHVITLYTFTRSPSDE